VPDLFLAATKGRLVEKARLVGVHRGIGIEVEMRNQLVERSCFNAVGNVVEDLVIASCDEKENVLFYKENSFIN